MAVITTTPRLTLIAVNLPRARRVVMFPPHPDNPLCGKSLVLTVRNDEGWVFPFTRLERMMVVKCGGG
jgi:hypothetical protein